MIRRVFLDLDGVLVDFVGGAASLHGFDRALVDRWDFIERVGLTPAEFWNPLGEAFWASLPWTEDGKEILKSVEDAVTPERICLLTSPCDTEGCLTGKHRWIREHLPDYRRRFLIGPPKEFLAAPDALLIDDSDTNCEGFVDSGGCALLVPRPWNGLSAMRRPEDWFRRTLKEMIEGEHAGTD